MRDPMEAFEDWLRRRPALWRAYVALNFCKGEYADGTPKEQSKAFNALYAVFRMECGCCAALRGFLAGALIGLLAWLLAWGL